MSMAEYERRRDWHMDLYRRDRDAYRAEGTIAIAQAKEVLKPGDRLLITRCGGAKVTVTMTGWDPFHPNCITSATLDDIHPHSIIKVNGAFRFFGSEIPS